ncbi:MAG: alanine racemase [Clostridiales bacterium]|nr:alanine racemase [Clostridiales bacterium]
MKRLVIEKQAVKHNVEIVREKAGAAVSYAVLTGDAYGAGLAEMGKLLREEGISRFAVSEPGDAAALRKAGLVEEEILMLRSITNRENLEALIDLNVVCTIGSYDTGVALNGLAEARATVVEAHLQLDTGMGLGGFLTEEMDKILAMFRYLPNVAISGVYTQIYVPKWREKNALAQEEDFQTALETIRAEGFETGTVHAAGSYALMHGCVACLDAVRVGSALMGRGRRGKDGLLTKVGYGEAALEEVRWLPRGHTVGTHRQVALRKPTRVAVIPVGSQNGMSVSFSRENKLWETLRRWWASRRMRVRIGGQRVKVIGSIGALETILDVTDVKCAAGDIAVFELDPLYAKGMERVYR